MKYILSLLIISFSLNAQTDFSGGQTYDKIKCKGAETWSYAVYLPKKYDHQRKEPWPVMFIWTANGGNKNTLKKLIPGAELTDCIVVCSTETSNKNRNNNEGMKATINGVLARFKCDPNFIFCTGISGGGRRTFLSGQIYGKGVTFTGYFPCGAGQSKAKLVKNAYYFGACGTNCFNREEMVLAFHSKIKKKGQLVWTAGGHIWAGEKIYTQGFAYLYANNLNKVRTSPREYELYYQDFCKELKELCDNETDIYRKYELLTTLSLVARNKESNAIKKELNTLKYKKEIKNYISAHADLVKFLKKYYRRNCSVLSKVPVNPKAVKAMNKLIEKYKDLPLTKIMKLLAEKTT